MNDAVKHIVRVMAVDGFQAYANRVSGLPPYLIVLTLDEGLLTKPFYDPAEAPAPDLADDHLDLLAYVDIQKADLLGDLIQQGLPIVAYMDILPLPTGSGVFEVRAGLDIFVNEDGRPQTYSEADTQKMPRTLYFESARNAVLSNDGSVLWGPVQPFVETGLNNGYLVGSIFGLEVDDAELPPPPPFKLPELSAPDSIEVVDRTDDHDGDNNGFGPLKNAW